MLPEGIEAIGSSSSQDEAEEEISPKFRKRRKMLRKSRAKRQKGIILYFLKKNGVIMI